MIKKFVFSILLMIITTSAFADVWPDATIIVAYSKNKEYMLKVYPLKFPDKYHTAKYHRQLKKGIVNDTITPCHAILYHLTNLDTTEIWNKPLVNRVSPVKVIIANDGKSVITIDEWHGRGFKHSLVVYGETGEVIKDFELEEITPFPVDQYFHSMSSIHWGGNGKYIDNDRVEIYFENEMKEMKSRIFNISEMAFE